MSRISLAQLAGSVRKLNLNRPFVCPILVKCWGLGISGYGFLGFKSLARDKWLSAVRCL
jgi:hypothetical protein